MDNQKKLQKSIDEVVSRFGKSIPIVEKRILNELKLLVKDLVVDSNGKVCSSVENLKKISTIGKKLNKLVFSKDYIRDVSDFVKGYNGVADAQKLFFPKNMAPNDYAVKVKQLSTDMVIDSLTENGMSANVVEPIKKMLIQNVMSGGSYADLTEYLEQMLRPSDRKGLISRYAETMAIDSINTFSRSYNSVLSQQAGYEWYTYQNSLIETSREFCIHMVKKSFFHKSEIPALLRGEIDGHQCKIYDATELPYGMKSDTDESNFIMYAGGWNCGHQIVGVPEEIVPIELREKFGRLQQISVIKNQYEHYGTEWAKVHINEKTGGYNVYHKAHQFTQKGGEAEKDVGKLLSDQNGKQVEFLPENGKGAKKPDVKFDGKTWDIKWIDSANENTIRTYIKESRKADNAIFYFPNSEKLALLRNAISRSEGYFKSKGTISEMPDIYYMDKEGKLQLLWKK